LALEPLAQLVKKVDSKTPRAARMRLAYFILVLIPWRPGLRRAFDRLPRRGLTPTLRLGVVTWTTSGLSGWDGSIRRTQVFPGGTTAASREAFFSPVRAPPNALNPMLRCGVGHPPHGRKEGLPGRGLPVTWMTEAFPRWDEGFGGRSALAGDVW
jgi:hypothetical protein